LPNIRNFVNAEGRLVTQLVNADVGSTAAFSGFLCDVARKTDVRYRDAYNDSLRIRSNVESPFEAAQIDALIRRGTYSSRPLVMATRTINALGGQPLSAGNADVLFTDGPAEFLGHGADGLATSDYPRYVEMIKTVMERLGWDPADFEAYRYHVEYPVMPSSVVVQFDLPGKPVFD
jgi:hypothetical protein